MYGVEFNIALFQLTTSQGGRLFCKHVSYCLPYFNSRPHKEVDAAWYGQGPAIIFISTHDLTRRSTADGEVYFYTDDISTHDLTRRSTQKAFLSMGEWNISTHDLTRRSTIHIPQHNSHYIHFNSRPHKEVDF